MLPKSAAFPSVPHRRLVVAVALEKEAAGKLRVFVRRPRFASTLDFEADRAPEFDKVVELSPGAGQRQLTIVLGRPAGAPDDWPRRACVSCRVDVELSGLFDAREGLD